MVKGIKTVISVIIIYGQFFKNLFNNKRGRKNIVIFNHFFDQDILCLKKANQHFNITVLGASAMNRLFRRFIRFSENEWFSFYDSVNDLPRKKFATVFKRFVIPVFKIFRIKAFVTPSDIFPYLRDTIPLLKVNGIKIFVIDKEGTISPYDFDKFSASIKQWYPFISDHILVWNERQRIFWQKCGIANMDMITVTGQPRSDFWFTNQTPSKELLQLMPAGKKNVLFFSFDKSAYIPEHLFKSGDITWNSLYHDVHYSIIEYARQNPEINFVIKTHPQQNTVDDAIQAICKQLPNVNIVGGAKISNELLKNADLVIGFQTTALIEAMFCNKPIIYTFWGDAPKIADYLIPFHQSNALFVAHSKEDLDNAYKQFMKSSDSLSWDIAYRKDFVERYFYKCDGQSSARTLKVMYEKIN